MHVVHGVAQRLLAWIVEEVIVHVVHHGGEPEPCVRIGEAERAAGARRAEGPPGSSPTRLTVPV